MKIPAKLGAAIDLAYRIRAERIEKQREYDALIADMKKQEEALQDHIVTQLKAAGLQNGRGSQASASWSVETQPSVKDWEKVWKFIIQNKAFDLMERRIAKVAFRDRLADGVAVPGIETFDVVKLSLTRVGEK